MNTQISVPVDAELFIELANFLKSHGDRRSPVIAVSDAIDYWLLNADMKPEDLLTKSVNRGFQWKSLFLPEATEIRMSYKGEYYYARVESDEIIYEGEPVSPSTLANTIAGSSRNAWRDLWIKRPGDVTWTLADDLRDQQQR